MNILITTASLQLVALTAHVIVWRIRLPRNHTKTLLAIFAAVFGLWLAAFAPLSTSLPDVLQTGLCYLSISLAYTITYSTIEGDSPTLSLILLIADSGDRGVHANDLVAFLSRRPFIQARIAALIRSGLVREVGDRFIAVSSPPIAFRIILRFRKLFGSIPRGG